MELVNQIKTYDKTINDKWIIKKFLISIPEKLDFIVAMIKETKDFCYILCWKTYGLADSTFRESHENCISIKTLLPKMVRINQIINHKVRGSNLNVKTKKKDEEQIEVHQMLQQIMI